MVQWQLDDKSTWQTPAQYKPSYELTNNKFADRRYAAFECWMRVFRLQREMNEFPMRGETNY